MTTESQATTDKDQKKTPSKDQAQPKKSGRSMKAKGKELPVTKKKPAATSSTSGVATWSRDMERMMDEVFESWSNFSKMIPFGGPLAKGQTDLANLTSWKEQTDHYFETVNRRWEELSKLSPYDMYRVPNGFLYKLKVDIEEDEDTYAITAELPGLDEDNIHLSIEDNELTISGNKCVDSERQGCVRERRFGSFLRSFTLPVTVNPDQAEARFKNGVLSITLPKAATDVAVGKEIPIKH